MDISWSFDGSEVISSLAGITTQKVGRKGSTLFIESVNAHHRGNYTCIARNDAGLTNYSTSLNVHGNLPVEISKP